MRNVFEGEYNSGYYIGADERRKKTLVVEVGMHWKILTQKRFRQYDLEEFSDLLDVRTENKTEVCMTLSF